MSRFVYILCIALLTASCIKVDSSENGSGNTITFGTQKGGGTRAATLIGGSDTDAFRAQPFSVYGDWIRDNGDRSEVFHDVEVSYTTDAKAPTGWIYDPIQHWQMDGSYEFRAYWPASSVVLGTATARTLALEYNMLQRNDDMMVAYVGCPTKNNGKPVELNFHHTLSAVAVKFMAPNAECEYRLKHLFFTSLNYIGALPYDMTDTTPDVTEKWVYGARSYVNPDDIMTYADLEWSEGSVYQQLGFSLEGRKSPVVFHIDPQWNRHPVHHEKALPERHCGDERLLRHDNLFYQNFGSNKFRLKLTDYE